MQELYWIVDDENIIQFKFKSIENHMVWGYKIHAEGTSELCELSIDNVFDEEIKAYESFGIY